VAPTIRDVNHPPLGDERRNLRREKVAIRETAMQQNNRLTSARYLMPRCDATQIQKLTHQHRMADGDGAVEVAPSGSDGA
jgi:hypothetical protein